RVRGHAFKQKESDDGGPWVDPSYRLTETEVFDPGVLVKIDEGGSAVAFLPAYSPALLKSDA
ncbi:uncharacterized, partial [Tachysurus ichikawai]